MTFEEEIRRDNKRMNEIYKREMEKGTYEDWLKRFYKLELTE